MKREEAISVLKEFLDNCKGLDGQYFELSPPATRSMIDGYQIIIKGSFDEKTKEGIIAILAKHQLAYQIGSMWKTKRSLNKTEPDTFIIYKPTQKKPKQLL